MAKNTQKNTEGTEVATTQASEVPAYIKQGGAARGSEGVGNEDLIIPRLEIVQSLSPARDKQSPMYIEGAEEGLLYNTVTRELYGDKMMVVPVMFIKEYLVWIDRQTGGGFRGAFRSREDAAARAAEVQEKCEVIDTATHLCLMIHDNGNVEEVMLSMSRSKMKVSRTWNSLIRIKGGDRFARQYLVSSIGEKNQRGQSYFNFRVSDAGFPTEEIYKRAEKLYEDINSGTKKVAADRSEEEQGGGEGGNAANEEGF
jgi:hypothetical protein